jgi:hypothetical protein
MNFRWAPMYNYYLTLPMHPDGDFFSCAVRVSMSLHHVGAFNKASYKKAGNRVSKHGWAMNAEQLYQWVRHHGLGEANQIPITPSDLTKLPQRNGIVYLRNCFVRSTDTTSATGDHFDLYVDGQGMLAAIRWPVEFPNGPFGLMMSCRDGIARFWDVR